MRILLLDTASLMLGRISNPEILQGLFLQSLLARNPFHHS